MDIPSGTVTFLFTDVEGSTRLWETDPDAMRSALERHDILMQAAFDACGGYVFATGGDGFGVSFTRAESALQAAVRAQQALADERWPEGAVIRVRMGAHTGSASERGGDYFGPPVNRAARLMAVAHGGQVVCSQSTASLADGTVPLVTLGEHRLRDLTAAEQVFQVGDGEFPTLRSVDTVPTNLPTTRTDLIGRSADLQRLMALAERERLVTLTGVGGVGKTRLALGLAAALADRFDDGCWLVELAPVVDGHDVRTAVAGAMGVPLTADTLIDYLSERRTMLLVDNCEHVLDSVADLVDDVLAAAPRVHVVATSREPLGIEGEHVRRVASLEMPDPESQGADAAASAAVRLFAERAAAVVEGFTVDDDNVDAVAEISRRLDGIPLAIELAAARVRAMAPPEIAQRLDERFRLLAGGSRRSQERHRTLLATVAWSHDLLDDDQRTVFRRLSVFPASFDLSAAEVVVGDPRIDVVDHIVRLVDQSLVLYEPDTDRYRLLETLRQYGAERLAEAGEVDATRERHGTHFFGVVDREGPRLFGPDYGAACDALGREMDSLRATADWCADTERWSDLAEMCLAIWRFLYQVTPVDLRVWHEQVLAHRDEVGTQTAVDCLGAFAFGLTALFGDHGRAHEVASASTAMAETGGVEESPLAWLAEATSALFSGEVATSVELAERSRSLAMARGDERVACDAVLTACGAQAVLGASDRAQSLMDEAIELAASSGDSLQQANVVTCMTNNHMSSDPPDYAAALSFVEGHPVEVPHDQISGIWVDAMRAVALLGLGESEAIRYAARAVRHADRRHALGLADFAIRQVAVIAAEHGLLDSASLLVEYAESALASHRLVIQANQELQERIEGFDLTAADDSSSGSTLSRNDALVKIREVEAAITGMSVA